jgi:hypothetical protein
MKRKPCGNYHASFDACNECDRPKKCYACDAPAKGIGWQHEGKEVGFMLPVAKPACGRHRWDRRHWPQDPEQYISQELVQLAKEAT